MKVLLFCPTYGDALRPETAACIERVEGIAEVLYQRENPNGEGDTLAGVLNHLHQFQTMRQKVIAGDWTHVLVVEHDMLVPPDIVHKLWSAEADVSYAPYMFRHGRPQLNLLATWGKPAKNPGPPFDSPNYRRRLAAALRSRQRVIDVNGSGFGCILIRRRVIEQIDYRLGEIVHCDHFWTKDVFAAGFSQRAHLDAICGHICPDGAVLWPDWTPADYELRIYDAGIRPKTIYKRAVVRQRRVINGMKVKALVSFVARVDGQTFRASAGDLLEMPQGVDWDSAGLVEQWNDDLIDHVETATTAATETAATATGKRKTTRKRKTTKKSSK